ncbi:MAG: hypothetical protein M3O34_00195, partial [Chloroflexota bacterium]|nr:hypothetical protein [Chloroflexota bacterium]
MNQSEAQNSAATSEATPDFPVVWERPGDEHGFWERDQMHFPEPITLLDDAFVRIIFEHGFNHAARHYEMPIRGAARRIGTYMYQSMAPSLPPEQMAAQGKRTEERISPVIARLGELWEREWLPELQRNLAEWRAFDLAGALLPELLAHADRTVERLRRVWEIHFEIAFPMLLAISLFDDFYRDLFGDEDAFQAYRLLQGFDNKTLETNRAIWTLSRRALAEPTVRRVFETLPAPEVVPALEGTLAGRAFLTELRTFLEAYGRRGDSWGLRSPGWIEDPTSVIRNVKDYVAQPDRDLEAERAALVHERERLIRAARERLRGYPRPVVEQFEGLLESAQVGNVLSEEHGFWIDFGATYEVRLVFLELGRRFTAAGVLDRPEDVFSLGLDEIRATAEALPALDRRAVVAERRAEMERFA